MSPRAHLGLALAAIIGTAGACMDLPTMGGGQPPEVIFPAEACPTPSANSLWTYASISVSRILPDRCPFTIQVTGVQIGFAFDGHAPKTYIGPGNLMDLWLVDWQGYTRGHDWEYWQTDPNDSFKWLSQFDIAALPGNAKPNTDGNLQDTARFEGYTTSGLAKSSLILNGKATLLRGTLLGPTLTNASSSEYFRAQPAVDTVGYRYRWTLNGTTLSGLTDASEIVSIATVGTHYLKVLAERTDLSVDTMSKTITVSIGASFTGLSVIPPNENQTWSVSAVGGTGPYTFEWYLDASYLQTGTSYTNAFFQNQSHWFDVKVTDNLGNIGWSSFNFYSTNEGGGEIELRSAPSPESVRNRKRPPGMPVPR